MSDNIPKDTAIKIIREMDSEKYIGKYSFNANRFKLDIIKKIIDSEENKLKWVRKKKKIYGRIYI